MKNIVEYEYSTGISTSKRYKHMKRHDFGPFQADIEDFRKFYEQIAQGGEVEELHLIVYSGEKRGVWRWRRDEGWIFFGR